MQEKTTSEWDLTAEKYWLKQISKKIKPEIIKNEIWDPLERDSFSLRSLLPLESLQILERFLWPTFSQDSSNQHVILIATFFNVKQRGNLQSWSLFAEQSDNFSHLFRRILSLNLDNSLSASSRVALLSFIIGAFQSLENDFVRKECAPLVSIAVWHNLHSETIRDNELAKSSSRKKAWRAAQKRFDGAEAEEQSRLKFDRAWLFSMLLDFLQRINTETLSSSEELTYCERFLEFLIDISSQLPTRRYTNTLIKDLNILPVLKRSKLVKRDDALLLNDLTCLLHHFQTFSVDDSDGQESTSESMLSTHYSSLAHLQRVAFKHFEDKLKVLALSNYASIDKREELENLLSALSDIELRQFCELLGFRTEYPPTLKMEIGRSILIEILAITYSRPQNFTETIGQLSVLPRTESLYDPALRRSESYDGSKPLAVPKLNLQYLSLNDFMWRSFKLYQNEAFYGIRKDMESIVRRLIPRLGRDRSSTIFEGFTKMALPIDNPAVIEVGAPNVGATNPSFVRAEVILDVSRLHDSMRKEWDSLRPRDVVFLLSIKAPEQSLTNGHTVESEINSGLNHVRAAEVVQILDDSGRPLRADQNVNGYESRSRRRRLLLDLDAATYRTDKEKQSQGKQDIYASINIIARRTGRENNFKPVLETIKNLVGSQTSLPSWLQEVFLGYGNPKSASFYQLQNKIESIDYLDTFLDWEHLNNSFKERGVEVVSGETPLNPPYIIQPFSQNSVANPSNPKKRRREQVDTDEISEAPVRVSSYKPQNTGPYPTDIPRKNTVRFTSRQVQAITSGAQPGLSLIVGPPGTGKTDVATQIINLLYHNFPSERILLVAHSNQALNQLFQKIIALDIDPRHLLRLGHGEEELEAQASYSKYGRVESFLENRQTYLGEVSRLAASIGAEGAHASSCETADYFDQVFIKPAWTKFWHLFESEGVSATDIISAFPFHKFFKNAPIPHLFPPEITTEEVKTIAKGCQYHIDKVFSELESIRPFEILRHARDQANHLLVKEARIIAMTSTHAAIRRSEVANLGFHYDTLIMEEAAQITEVESFIPCAMQNPDAKTGELPLKRIVLVGDHLQNSPVIQNMALRQYANFEQSLFLRLVRLGVPTIRLDQQGRCRPSIAELFKWRYEGLGNLPHLIQESRFSHANAGFRYDYQFIDVPDYQGQGEREPTPHFIQNLGEAEYAVALYQYMRLLGYPARDISILTTYAGQRALIRDVLEHRCKGNRLFGLPRIVTTVDKYQGEQNDYVILSMTRTRNVGYLRDVRRITVALSRARLGLYILGRRDLFETCYEMKPAMSLLSERPAKLVLTTGEMFPTNRNIEDDVQGTEMEGVEHLGQYVFEMTQAKIKSLGGSTKVQELGQTEEGYAEDDDLADEADVVEEDPLHEAV